LLNSTGNYIKAVLHVEMKMDKYVQSGIQSFKQNVGALHSVFIKFKDEHRIDFSLSSAQFK
jgi:hypothetical protein